MNPNEKKFYNELMKELFFNFYPHLDREEEQYNYNDRSDLRDDVIDFDMISWTIKVFLLTYRVSSSEAKKTGIDFSDCITILKDMVEAFIVDAMYNIRNKEPLINHHIEYDKRKWKRCDEWLTAEIMAENVQNKLISLMNKLK